MRLSSLLLLSPSPSSPPHCSLDPRVTNDVERYRRLHRRTLVEVGLHGAVAKEELRLRQSIRASEGRRHGFLPVAEAGDAYCGKKKPIG